MSNRRVWVEVDLAGNPIRILKHVRFGRDMDRIREMPKFDAVGAIRKQIWKRCAGRCEWCGKPVTESGSLQRRMNMHEVIPKGNGGQVALDNSVGICYDCHFNDPAAHGNRKPQWSLET